MLANYQILDEGGQGWLRILRIDPAQNCIEVKTYSPYLDKYAEDAENQFTIANAFRPGFFAAT